MIEKVTIEDYKLSAIKIQVVIINVPSGEGTYITDTSDIIVSGFLPTPPKIDLTTDINGKPINSFIDKWIDENKRIDLIKEDLAVKIRYKLDSYLNGERIPKLWKTIITPITAEMIEAAIQIITTDGSLDTNKIVEIKLNSNALSSQINTCSIGTVYWSIYESSIHSQLNAYNNTWLFIILIAYGIIILVILIVILIVYIRKCINQNINTKELMKDL